MEMSKALNIFNEVELERSKGATVLEACTKAKCSPTTYYQARRATEKYRNGRKILPRRDEATQVGESFSDTYIDDRIKQLIHENDALRAENQRLKNRLVRDAIENGSIRDMVVEYLLNQE